MGYIMSAGKEYDYLDWQLVGTAQSLKAYITTNQFSLSDAADRNGALFYSTTNYDLLKKISDSKYNNQIFTIAFLNSDQKQIATSKLIAPNGFSTSDQYDISYWQPDFGDYKLQIEFSVAHYSDNTLANIQVTLNKGTKESTPFINGQNYLINFYQLKQ